MDGWTDERKATRERPRPYGLRSPAFPTIQSSNPPTIQSSSWLLGARAGDRVAAGAAGAVLLLDGSLSVEGTDLMVPSAHKPFVGLFDELRLYRRALTAAEIGAVYDRERPNRPSVDYERM